MAEKMTLLPCPFCGSTDVETYPADRERSRWNVCCGNPGCVTRGDNDYLTQADSVAAWNRRHIAQPAQAVDALQDAIFQIAERLGEVRDPDMDDMSWHTQLIARAQYLANAQAVDVGAILEVIDDMREALKLIAEHAAGITGQSGMGMDSGWVAETARAACSQSRNPHPRHRQRAGG